MLYKGRNAINENENKLFINENDYTCSTHATYLLCWTVENFECSKVLGARTIGNHILFVERKYAKSCAAIGLLSVLSLKKRERTILENNNSSIIFLNSLSTFEVNSCGSEGFSLY